MAVTAMSPPFHAPPPGDGDIPSALSRVIFLLVATFFATLFVSLFSSR